MGKLRIVEGGIRVEGKTEFLKALYASKIRSTQVSWARKYINGLPYYTYCRTMKRGKPDS